MQKLVGTIEYENLEGGVWMIAAEDGRRLVLENLPKEFLKAGLKVELSGEEEASFGIAMMGNTFNVQKAKRL